MNTAEAYDILICVGCAMMAANGENIGDGGDGVAPLSEVEDGWIVAVDEPWGFATSSCDGCGSSCDGCGSHLAGDRFQATTFPIN